MVVNASLSWEEAIAFLDANFNFKTLPANAGQLLSYRLTPNGRELAIDNQDGRIAVELPNVVLSLATSLVGSTQKAQGERHRYVVNDLQGLAEAVRSIRGEVTAPKQRLGTFVPKLKEQLATMDKPRNLILHGPPGTGKTFKSAEIAVDICDGSAPASREELMRRYEELQREGRIRFVTFHQSYSYEDFVEGLRPEITNGNIIYRIRQGIFREACEAARRSLLVKPGLTGKPLEERTFYKMSLGRAGTVEGNAQFEDCIQKGEIQLGWGEDIDFTDCKSPDDIRATVLRERPDC